MGKNGILSVDRVTTPRGFLALEDEWDALAASAGTVFLTHFWLSAWLREYARSDELRVLTARDGARLVAAMPLIASEGLGAPREWTFMGSGLLTPNHLDLLAAPGYESAALEAFTSAISGASDEWDVLDLDKLPADTPTSAALEGAFRANGLDASSEVSAVCPHADLPGTPAEYLESLSKRSRGNARKKLRRVMKEHPSAKLGVVEDGDGLDRALGALVRQHQARWESRGYAGAFGDPRSVRFHREVATDALTRGCLRCYTLDIDGAIAAVAYGFRTGDVVQQYQNSMADEWQDLSPGLVVLVHAIEQSIAEGARRYDLLEGEEEYKRSWCSSERRNLRLKVFNRTPRGQLARVRESSRIALVSAARRWVPPQVRESYVKGLSHYRAARTGQ